MLSITNKKYQKIKVLINDTQTVSIGPKETANVNIKEPSLHMKDLEKEGLINIKKVER
jgi:hypothetical protein